MRRVLTIVGVVVASILVLVLVVIFGATNTDWGRERVRRFAVSALNKSAHGKVRIGKLSGNLLSGAILSDFSITDSAGNPFLSVDRTRVRYSLRPFLSKKIILSGLTLEHPVIVMDKPPGGDWNWKRIFPSDTTRKDTTRGFGSWIKLNDVRVANGRFVVRTPWSPSDTLKPAQRDSVIRVALSGEGRANIERVPGGFQTVMDFREMNAFLPRLRLADPDTTTRLFQVASLQMTALPFRPPAAEVRDLRGTFLMDTDSLWFRGVNAALPSTKLGLDGTYVLEPGNLDLRMSAAPLALADVRFGYPRLPAKGGGSLNLVMRYRPKGESDYVVRDVDLTVADATLAGQLGLAMRADSGTLRLHDTDFRFAKVDTKLLEQLVPNLKIPRRGVLAGRAALEGSQKAMRLDADVAFDDSRAGRTRVVAVGGVGTAPGVFHADSLHLRFEPLQVALARVANPKLPVGGTITGTVVVNGSTASRLAASADLVHRDRGAVSHLVGSGAAALRGRRWVDANLTFQPLALATVGRFAPAAGLRGTAAGRVRVTGEMRALRLNGELRLPDGGEFTTRGQLDLASAQKGYDVSTALRVFNLRAVSTRGPVTSLTALATVNGRGTDPKTMRATVAADVARSSVDSTPLDSVHARVVVAGGLLTLDSLLMRTPFARASAGGTFGLAPGQSGELAYQVAIDSLAGLRRYFPPSDTVIVPPRPARVAALRARARADSIRAAAAREVELAATGARPRPLKVDTIPGIRRDSIAGSVYTAGVVKGGLSGFNLRGRLALENVVAQGSSVNRGRLEYAWIDARTPRSAMVAGASLDSVQAAGFALDSVEVRGAYKAPDGHVDVAIYQDTLVSYRAKTDFALHLDHSEAHISDVQLRFDTTQWVSARPGTVRWGKRGIEVQTLELRSGGNGRIYVNGLLPTEGPANLELKIEGLELANLSGLLQSDVAATGQLALSTRLTGTRQSPIIGGAAALMNVSVRGTPLPDARASFRYANTELTAHAELVRGRGAPLAVADAMVPVNLALAGYTGPRMLDRPMRVDVRADSLMLDALPKFTDAVSDVHGRIIGVVAVRGTMKKPSVAGRLGLDFASFRMVPMGVTLREITGAVHMLGDTVVIDSILGYSGSGPIRLVGRVGIANPSNPTMSLALTARDAIAIDNEQGRLNVNADIGVSGSLERAVVAGSARILHGVMYIPKPTQQQNINAGDPAVFSVIDTSVANTSELVPAQSPLMQNLRIAVRLAVNHDTWVRSAEANVEIYTPTELNITIDRARQAMVLDGTVNTERGQYAFLGRRFTLSRGSATFVGDPQINPILQLAAEHEVQVAGREALHIQIIIGGTMRSPRVTLESDAQPPISQSDLLSYLAFGQSSTSLLQTGGSSGTSGAGTGGGLVGQARGMATRQLAAVAIGALTTQFEQDASRQLGADQFDVTPADVPSELSLTSAQSVLLGTQVEAGKYIGRRTFVAIQARPTFVAPGISVEQRWAKGYRLQASVGPRVILREPSLATVQEPNTKQVFGSFLIREWRF